jgi:hypothetical protein
MFCSLSSSSSFPQPLPSLEYQTKYSAKDFPFEDTQYFFIIFCRVETCSGVINCEIIVHLLVIVQNKQRPLVMANVPYCLQNNTNLFRDEVVVKDGRFDFNIILSPLDSGSVAFDRISQLFLVLDIAC